MSTILNTSQLRGCVSTLSSRSSKKEFKKYYSKNQNRVLPSAGERASRVDASYVLQHRSHGQLEMQGSPLANQNSRQRRVTLLGRGGGLLKD